MSRRVAVEVKIRPQAPRTANHFSTFNLVAPGFRSADHQGPAGARSRVQDARPADRTAAVLDSVAALPPLDSLAADTEARLPLIAGAH
jgi:hypothetical protein